MSIYFEPVDIRHWNLFECVKEPGHIESFLATKTMHIGDIVLFHVGQQDKNVPSGIYAVGKVQTDPYIKKNVPDERCNNRLTVDVRIDSLSGAKPYITHEDCKKYIRQFRTVHQISDEWAAELMALLK